LDGLRKWLAFSVLDFYVMFVAVAFFIYHREHDNALATAAAEGVGRTTAAAGAHRRAACRTLAWCAPMALLGSPVALVYVALVVWRKH
jgi:hypothetical protein